MALIVCKECNKNVSNEAKTCPGCGFKLIKYRWLKILISSVIVVAIFFVGSAYYVVKKSEAETVEAVTKIMTDAGYSNISISYSKFKKLNDRAITCGTARAIDENGNMTISDYYLIKTGIIENILEVEVFMNSLPDTKYYMLCVE